MAEINKDAVLSLRELETARWALEQTAKRLLKSRKELMSEPLTQPQASDIIDARLGEIDRALRTIAPSPDLAGAVAAHLMAKMNWNGAQVEDVTSDLKAVWRSDYVTPSKRARVLLAYYGYAGSSIITEIREALNDYGGIRFIVNKNGPNRKNEMHHYLIQILWNRSK